MGMYFQITKVNKETKEETVSPLDVKGNRVSQQLSGITEGVPVGDNKEEVSWFEIDSYYPDMRETKGYWRLKAEYFNATKLWEELYKMLSGISGPDNIVINEIDELYAAVKVSHVNLTAPEKEAKFSRINAVLETYYFFRTIIDLIQFDTEDKVEVIFEAM